jgi:hypothetical protein
MPPGSMVTSTIAWLGSANPISCIVDPKPDCAQWIERSGCNRQGRAFSGRPAFHRYDLIAGCPSTYGSLDLRAVPVI